MLIIVFAPDPGLIKILIVWNNNNSYRQITSVTFRWSCELSMKHYSSSLLLFMRYVRSTISRFYGVYRYSIHFVTCFAVFNSTFFRKTFDSTEIDFNRSIQINLNDISITFPEKAKFNFLWGFEIFDELIKRTKIDGIFTYETLICILMLDAFEKIIHLIWNLILEKRKQLNIALLYRFSLCLVK